MQEIILVKCGEMILKGLNRKRFEDRLIKNINHSLSKVGNYNVYSLQSTLYVESKDDSPIDKALEALKKIFGIVVLEKAVVCEKNIASITETAIKYLEDKVHKYSSFKVETKRADKNFPKTSVATSVEVGGNIHEAYPQLKPDMHTPDITVYVEIRDRNAFIYAEKIKGAGGMPTSTSGKATLLISGGIDSPVAGYMMAKRGVSLSAVHFHSYPYTSEQAKQKVIDLGSIVSDYSGKIKMYVVSFTKIQEAIRKNCQEDMFTIIMRRFMMKIADEIAKKERSGALITGESLGQVASQTLEAINVTNEVCTLPVFRPLIGMDKEEIIVISKKIGAFETSILPYEDCCTVFTPRHPQTKPKLYLVEKQEAKIENAEELICEAIDTVEILEV